MARTHGVSCFVIPNGYAGLYNLIDLGHKTESHTVELQFQTPGVQAYTFTFG